MIKSVFYIPLLKYIKVIFCLIIKKEFYLQLLVVGLTVYLLNIPFGYWRENIKKFSIQWALAIHTPIPFIILLRLYSGIGFQFVTYPVLIGAFFIGQLTGSYILQIRRKNDNVITSCLVMDLIRSKKSKQLNN